MSFLYSSICDDPLNSFEVDGYPGDVDGEGNPVSPAEKRTDTFSRKQIFMVSTPKIRGFSRIESEYLSTDQRKYFVPCPHCRNYDWIRWPNIQWEEGLPDTARLLCESCGSLIEESHKTWMLERGQWKATSEKNRRTAGFHLSSLYSPLGWRSWAAIAQEFLASKNDPAKLKTWVNTSSARHGRSVARPRSVRGWPTLGNHTGPEIYLKGLSSSQPGWMFKKTVSTTPSGAGARQANHG